MSETYLSRGRLTADDRNRAAKMRTWRTAGGITMQRAAALVGIDPSTWREVEDGRRYVVGALEKKINALIAAPLAIDATASLSTPSSFGEELLALSKVVGGLRANLSGLHKRIAALESGLGIPTAAEKMSAANPRNLNGSGAHAHE